MVVACGMAGEGADQSVELLVLLGRLDTATDGAGSTSLSLACVFWSRAMAEVSRPFQRCAGRFKVMCL
ncbi:hypothetical protein [Ahrensia kielensis]|uniref:hypothetical protein n=1 Tax=Ahrensia kielensis TaxID=76980 RepID=UPI00035E8F4C|nr:hypothetical protein [Ahrensia kielensis]